MKRFKHISIGIIIGIVIFGSVVYAATSVYSSNVTYDNSSSGLISTNVQGALDELYIKSQSLRGTATSIDYQYSKETKTTVTTAGGESVTQVANQNLMQDSFGNIRFYGASPNNYVTFNGEEAGWRIIGVFDVEDANGNIEKRIKLIRDESIGSYAYDNKPSGVGTSISAYGSNNWTDARLMMLLNPGYETASTLYAYEGSLYWNSKSGTCYAGSSGGTTTCDFTSTGLTDEAKSMISQAKYYLGGSSSYEGLYADDYYTFERGTIVSSGHATEWTGYVGIMYPSDYAYATDLSLCSNDGFTYSLDTANCTGTDWLFNGTYQWTISPCSSHDYFAFRVDSSGYISRDGYVYNAFEMRPVVYLDADISIVDGSGKENDPYILVDKSATYSASSYVTDLYEKSNHTTITTAGSEKIIQASTVNLMEDSFGNIRYYGASPNNYVTFNGETAGWRIIGVFKIEDENGNIERRVKLIKNSSIGLFVYDDTLNDWSSATLNTYLNGDYYTGLTTGAKIMIGQSKYYLGGFPYHSGLYADDYYHYERGTTVYSGNQTEWTGYLGIMYPSDYAYATDLSVCTYDGYNYPSDTTNCNGTDWLLDTSVAIWTISGNSVYSDQALLVYGEGFVSHYIGNERGVRPVLYLNSNVSIVSGEGTSDNPYVLN